MGDHLGYKNHRVTCNKSNSKYFLNYFGPQRFGKAFNNHIIGEFILNKKYDEAINLTIWTVSNEEE